ncbi:hypothetical protein PABG_11857 [Paracoccidioides brasiliensis Pb03]|uniref:Uncharacterized protein n=2 Tax=Paracoccidioides brasiliensis TaxID=121759 RepID=A0A0A0HUB6_PARBD|nr:uncharacterized protein PADG_12292 [Paracoccidioides brasiliensis Pb18]KGM91611.1 hypothetical protein PADG_12292 [Paracoccidioides brasiliensis Pb18]KGY15273.1 hypothetical protein PABG_11857 [Paracoccidioides brasiliensis Pb03]ODH26423.1 hypothetical protein ACO22_04641 [Paracoccidioides brasiliensis]ODH51999.1 hypothetical protein GX48_01787 [Paracoccidioides brasiliensis]
MDLRATNLATIINDNQLLRRLPWRIVGSDDELSPILELSRHLEPGVEDVREENHRASKRARLLLDG